MKNCTTMPLLLGTLLISASSPGYSQTQSDDAPRGAMVHVVITDMAVQSNNELPTLMKDDVKVKQGKTMYTVTQLIPARDQAAGLQLMILIDETLNIQAVGNNLTDLKEFVKAQPPATVIGIGYMANAGVNVVQQFTTDHEAAVNAIRLPRGGLSTMDSPYLSLISLVKGWPKQNIRREVLMITDGIDRLHGEAPMASQLGSRFGARGTNGPTVYHSMPTISIDADSASETSQRYNVIVSSIYSPGVGRAARSLWDLDLGLGGLSKIADETGGECYSLGTSNAVSFKPYLDRFQKNLNNQYYLVFLGEALKKGTLQRIKIWTEQSNSEIAAPDNVWIPGPQHNNNDKQKLELRPLTSPSRRGRLNQAPRHRGGSIPLASHWQNLNHLLLTR
jgi:hypothetical protein